MKKNMIQKLIALAVVLLALAGCSNEGEGLIDPIVLSVEKNATMDITIDENGYVIKSITKDPKLGSILSFDQNVIVYQASSQTGRDEFKVELNGIDANGYLIETRTIKLDVVE